MEQGKSSRSVAITALKQLLYQMHDQHIDLTQLHIGPNKTKATCYLLMCAVESSCPDVSIYSNRRSEL